MNRKNTSIKFTNYSLLGLYGIWIAIFLIFTPKYIDDLWFMAEYRDWFLKQGIFFPENGGNFFKYGIPWDAFVATVKDHYYTDNARLCNIVGAFMLLFPKWFGSLFPTLAWCYTVKSIFSFAQVDIKKSALVALGLIMLTFAVPWGEQMGSLIFQYNYLISAILSFVLIKEIFRAEWNQRRYLFAPILALVLGAWQESFSLPIFGTLVVMMIWRKEWRNKRNLLIAAALLTGILWIFSSPGHQHRAAGNYDAFSSKFTIHHLSRFAATVIPTIVAFTLWCTLAAKQGIKSAMTRNYRLFQFLMISALISAVLVFATQVSGRVGFWGRCASIYGILYLLRNARWGWLKQYRWNNSWLYIPMILLMCSHWIATDYYLFKMRKSLFAILDYQASHPGRRQYFTDIYDPVNTPWICMWLPNTLFFTVGMHSIITYTTGDGERDLFWCVPRELEYVTSESGESLDGDSGMRIISGRCYRKPLNADDGLLNTRINAIYEIDYGSHKESKICRELSFTSKADGNRYIYVYPFETLPEYYFCKKKGMTRQ